MSLFYQLHNNHIKQDGENLHKSTVESSEQAPDLFCLQIQWKNILYLLHISLKICTKVLEKKYQI